MQDTPISLEEYFAPCDPELVRRLVPPPGDIDRVNPDARVGCPLDLLAMRDALARGDVAQFENLELNYFHLLFLYLFSHPSLDYGAISWDGVLHPPPEHRPGTPSRPQTTRKDTNMRYEFRTTTGRVCCAGEGEPILCPTCRAQAQVVSPPPDLFAAIRAARAPNQPTPEDRVLAFFVNAPRRSTERYR